MKKTVYQLLALLLSLLIQNLRERHFLPHMDRAYEGDSILQFIKPAKQMANAIIGHLLILAVYYGDGTFWSL